MHVYNVGFNGGIAEVEIEPTEEMLYLESERQNLLTRAQAIGKKIFQIGQNIAYDQFKQKHPNIAC